MTGKEKTVLISGGTSGLGFAAAKQMIQDGHHVVICGRSKKTLSRAIKDLSHFSEQPALIHGFQCDVADHDQVRKMGEKLRSKGLQIEYLICNAGVIGPIETFLNVDLEEWVSAFDINLFGTLYMVKEFLPDMLSRNSGRVIHVSGGGATAPLHGMTSYAASKAAAVRFVESLALEYITSEVTFNSIAPGMLKTQLLDQMLSAGESRIGSNLYQKSVSKSGQDSDSTGVAVALIKFLTSPESRGISGKLISAEWDNWTEWSNHLSELRQSDVYTLRRITGNDRNLNWGDV